MPVVSSTFEATPQANGGFNVTERHVIGPDGDVKTSSWYAAPGVDIQAVVLARVPWLDEQLAQDEFESIIGS